MDSSYFVPHQRFNFPWCPLDGDTRQEIIKAKVAYPALDEAFDDWLEVGDFIVVPISA